MQITHSPQRMFRRLNLSLLLTAALTACQSTPNTSNLERPNTPAPGFNAANSDPDAINIADQVMQNLGGRKAWDNTRYIAWDFFGARHLLWDKQSGDVRIEFTNRDGNKITWLMNINTIKGRVTSTKESNIKTDPEILQQGYQIWINDSYWLVMPYKLKDSGVTLKYLGESTTEAGNKPANLLELTFDSVGITPANKYHVWVGKSTGLVEQWAYFTNASEPEPRFTLPWTDWKWYGPPSSRIRLSTGRGERTLSQIGILDRIPDGALTSFNPIDWDRLATTPSDSP